MAVRLDRTARRGSAARDLLLVGLLPVLLASASWDAVTVLGVPELRAHVSAAASA